MSQAQIPRKGTAPRRLFWTVHLPAWVWAVLLFTASSFPVLPAPDLGFDWQDKVYHMVAYGILGWLMARSAVGRRPATSRLFWISVGLGTLYGVTDELHQILVPGRFCDFFDGLADALGVLVGHALYFRWHLRRDSLTAI